MPVSHDLQNIVSDISTAIAAGKKWGRTDLERLRRSLTETAREVAEGERHAGAERLALGELVAGIDRGVADLTGLARRAGAVAQAGADR